MLFSQHHIHCFVPAPSRDQTWQPPFRVNLASVPPCARSVAPKFAPTPQNTPRDRTAHRSTPPRLPLHSGTFYHSNPAVPEYGLHDIARIGSSKAKLADLVDREIFRLEDLPTDLELTAIQRNQVDAYLHDRILIRQDEIAAELRKLVFPGYFLDYETCPAAVPRFDGYSPYQQIPFQYSLHVLDRADGDPRHEEFLSTTPGDPSAAMCASLQKHIGSMGSVVVWNKKFECTINRELSERIPAAKAFLDSLNGRIYDLMDVFSKQLGELFLRVVKPGRNGFQRRRP